MAGIAVQLWVLVLSLAFTGCFGQGDFCSAGYFSSTNRLWTLGNLPQLTTSTLTLNLCARQPTACEANAVVCQNPNVTVARRDTWDVLQTSTDTTLVVAYANGDSCQGGVGYHSLQVNFHCQDGDLANTWVVTADANSCAYTADIYVPTSQCAISTAQPAPFCYSSGYVSPTGRIWTLSGLSANVTSNYNWQIDVCGTTNYSLCGAGSVSCQGGTSLGQRWSGDIQDVYGNDTTLTTVYVYGTACASNVGERRVYIYYHCMPTNITPTYAVKEVSTCHYQWDVNIPISMCQPGGPITPIPSVPPFCTQGGYIAPNGYNYNLGSLMVGLDQEGIFTYEVNPCGRNPNPCGLSSAACQAQPSGPTSLGLWTTWNIRPPVDATTMSVHFGLGLMCGGTARQAIMNFNCSGKTASTIKVYEYSTCVYTINIDVPTSMCSKTNNEMTSYPQYCTGGGLYYGGRRWILNDFNLDEDDATNNFQFNLCGTRLTPCTGTTAAVCRQPQTSPSTTGGVSIGNALDPVIKYDLATSTNLVVEYRDGGYCTSSNLYFVTTITFVCQGSLSAEPGQAFSIVTVGACGYAITVSVPAALCPSALSATYPWCDPVGYYSLTGRLWNLNALTVSTSYQNYDLHLDLCGNNPTPCSPDTVLCQTTGATSGYSVASRFHATVVTDTVSDANLAVDFGLGDDCGGVGARSARIIFQCQIGSTLGYGWNYNMAFSEPSTCHYQVTINVPEFPFCTQTVPGQSTFLPFCSSAGWVDSWGTKWQLSLMNEEFSYGNAYEIVLNLCGTTPTGCVPGTSACQEKPGTYNSLGSYFAGSIDQQASSKNTLVVVYGNGTYCGAILDNRRITVFFTCGATPYGIPNVYEGPTCHYNVWVNVPPSMCSTATPTDAVVAPFCANGYKSPSGRVWALNNFVVDDFDPRSYQFILNLCGEAMVGGLCDSSFVICQEDRGAGYGLAARWTYQIQPQYSDLVLTVSYTNGDLCGGYGARQVIINFACTPAGQNYVPHYTVVESPTCTYVANITVPSSYCPQDTNAAIQPWCTNAGYSSSTGRLWQLANYQPPVSDVYPFGYLLNLCGRSTTSCPYHDVLCQENGVYNYATGVRPSWKLSAASTDKMLVVDYSLGDWCGVVNADRTMTIQFQCATYYGQAGTITVSEFPVCHYTIQAFVPQSLCTQAAAPIAYPSFCQDSGYVSPTGRTWKLSSFSASKAGTYPTFTVLNPCTHHPTSCVDSYSALCQMQSYGVSTDQKSYASSSSYTITPVDDLDIVVTYTGDVCSGSTRWTTNVTFHCSNGGTNFVLTSTGTCSWSASVNVPTSMCTPKVAAVLPEFPAPYCQPGGYYANGVVWKLAGYSGYPAQETSASYFFNLCGGQTTFCPNETVLCQEYNDFSYYSLGQRWSWSIVPGNKDPSQLVLLYSGGTDTFCSRQRSVYVFLHCTDTNAGLFSVTEYDGGVQCSYRLDAQVPTSYCQTSGPTSPPAIVPAYCNGNGYLSPTGRQWLLNAFSVSPDYQSGYEWTLQLCSTPTTGDICNNNDAIICQNGNTIGLRSTSFVNKQLSTDTMLYVEYYNGGWCGNNDNRDVAVRYHCTDQLQPFNMAEPYTCHYVADIYVPTIYCPSRGGQVLPPAPYCKRSGFYHNGRTWNLQNFNIHVPEGEYTYILDICGNQYTFCSWDSVMCQVYNNGNQWSVGARSYWNVDEDLSNSNTLVISYGGGDDCGGAGARAVTIYFSCTDLTVGSLTDFVLVENRTCHYLAYINIGTENCPTTSAPPAPPAYCTENGLRSVTNRLWTLQDFVVSDGEKLGWNYVLNLCGDDLETNCADDAVICQETGTNSGISVGSRHQYAVIVPAVNDPNADLTLTLQFINGDYCGGQGNRVTNLVLHCTDNTTNPFRVYENPVCTYNIDINVPTSMCQPGPTITSPAPYCDTNGYLSPTNRVWQLKGFDPNYIDDQYKYDWKMDLCGDLPRSFCTPGSVVCQIPEGGGGWSVGSRWAWTISPASTDLDLVVVYGLGDSIYCAGPRFVIVNFHCLDGQAAAQEHMQVHEFSTCKYNVTVNVPAAKCYQGSATNPPAPIAPWCKEGFVSDTGRVWTLKNYDFDAKNGWDYTFDLCGTWNTLCDPRSVICQTGGLEIGSAAYSVGRRSTGVVIADQSNDTMITIRYTLGDDCGGTARQAYVRFHCGGDPSQYIMTENPGCTYNFDVNVPMSMCVAYGPTGAPPPVADWCTPYGYYSPTGRLWSLSTFTANDPTNSYNYVLDLCGQQPTSCAYTDTLICQEVNPSFGYNLALRSTFQVAPHSDDTTLIIHYGLGDNCGGQGDRQVWLYLHCQDGDNALFTLVEAVTCRYNASINVPTRFCQPQSGPSPTPKPVAPYCQKTGYVSPTGRIWTLGNINVNDHVFDYDYQLDLCGNFPTPCAPEMAMCQIALDGNAYDLGTRGSHAVLEDQGNDTTLVVSYSVGANIYCGGVDRTTMIYFHCTTGTHTTMAVYENPATACHYRADVYVAAALCSTVAPPTPQLPPFCYYNGYLSNTGRYWTFQKFFPTDIQDTYDFELDVCGNAPNDPCGLEPSAVCQQAGRATSYSLGNRYNYTILPSSSDTTLVITYLGGDWCAVINDTRRVTITFNCTDTDYPYELEVENETCHYTLNIQVPLSYCSTTPPPALPTAAPGVDFCAPAGLKTDSQTTWKLAGFNPNDPQDNYDYVLDLCGDTPTVCDGVPAICQEAGETYGWSLGDKNNYTYDGSIPGTLVIHYMGGDYCDVVSDWRQAWVILTCTDTIHPGFHIVEYPTCNYTAYVNVPKSKCPNLSGNLEVENPGQSKKIGSGAVAGITVAVVAVAGVASVVGGLKLYKMKKIRRFQAQID